MKRLIFSMLTMLLMSIILIAVTQVGTLIVTVISEEGQLLPGASVMIKSTNMIGTRTQVTGANGKTTFRNLPPGEYVVNVNMDKFQPVERNGIFIYIQKATIIEIELEQGAADEVITVVATTPMIDTSSSTMVQHYSLDHRRSTKEARRIKKKTTPETKKTDEKTEEEQISTEKRKATKEIKIVDWNTEEYAQVKENEFLESGNNPLSTFSIDVDTASYTNIRRFLNDGNMPYTDAVRIEEMVNYFDYDYPEPEGEHPFEIYSEVAPCPWNEKHKLVQIGIQGKRIKLEERPENNLVFLLDVSGSMTPSDKLPLLVKAMKVLVNNLTEKDTVSIVVYAGAAGLVLPPTNGNEKDTIIAALEELEAGGSTAGGAGIQLAYKIAEEQFLEDGNNRVILATDGDFNIGVSSTSELVRMIEEKRDKGIYLTTLGFGMGNYKDSRMEQMADNGNGNYYYIDNFNEARKVFGSDLTGTIFTIAKDVKIQVEFNPAKVQSYRLIGYENRMLKKEDFNDDKKDAGELGAGHNVTALYEITPPGSESEQPEVDELKFQETKVKDAAYETDEIMQVKFRYKPPKEDESILIVHHIKDHDGDIETTSARFRFSAAVAAFGMMLRDSKYKGDFTYNKIIQLAQNALGADEDGHRREFITMVQTAKELDTKQK